MSVLGRCLRVHSLRSERGAAGARARMVAGDGWVRTTSEPASRRAVWACLLFPPLHLSMVFCFVLVGVLLVDVMSPCCRCSSMAMVTSSRRHRDRVGVESMGAYLCCILCTGMSYVCTVFCRQLLGGVHYNAGLHLGFCHPFRMCCCHESCRRVRSLFFVCGNELSLNCNCIYASYCIVMYVTHTSPVALLPAVVC